MSLLCYLHVLTRWEINKWNHVLGVSLMPAKWVIDKSQANGHVEVVVGSLGSRADTFAKMPSCSHFVETAP